MDIMWYTYSSADGYLVYRWDKKNHKYIEIEDVTKHFAKEFTDEGLEYKQLYQYKIRGYKVKEDGTRVYTRYSDSFYGNTKTRKPYGVYIETIKPENSLLLDKLILQV